MSMGGGYDAPEPSYQQQALTAKQNQYMGMQMESMQKQEALQETQRNKVMREESTTAAKEAESRSDYRRRGAMGDAVTAQGYGGYRGRDKRGGVGRSFKGQASTAAELAKQKAAAAVAQKSDESDESEKWIAEGPLGSQTFDQRYQARNYATRWNNQNVADSGEWHDSMSWRNESNSIYGVLYKGANGSK